MDRLYCTLAELVEDLERAGVKAWKEAGAMAKIRSASGWIDQNLGQFIPIIEAVRLDGEGGSDLFLPKPLLSVSSIVDDSNTLLSADYLLYPRNRLWENGPYTRISLDPDATTISTWSCEKDIIVVTGGWGLYELSKATGATVANQDNSSTSLVVNSAAAISPGAVLLIESEQELVEATGSATDSTANTAEEVDASEEEITLDNAALVNIGEILKLEFEQMKLLDKASNVCLVERGWNGTKKTTHATGLDVNVYRTFTVKRGVNGTTAAAHSSKAISRYYPPFDVNYLCRQMAALMMKKAESGFAGKVGNADLGEVFYMQEFPKEVIKRIEEGYRVW